MKKILLVLLLLVPAVNVSAAPVSNPAQFSTQEIEEAVFSYEGEYVISRDLDTGRDGKLENLQGHYAKLSYVFEEPVEMYGLLGVTKFDYSQSNSSSFETDFNLAFGFGMKWQFWKNESGTAIGIDGKYRATRPLNVSDAMLTGTRRSMSDVRYKDWQIALGTSYPLTATTNVYGGVKYNDLEITRVSPFRIQGSESIFGPFIGAQFNTGGDLQAMLEVHVLDEFAITGDIVFHF